MIVEISNRTRGRFDIKLLETVIKNFLVSRKLTDVEVSLAFVGDRIMRRLNWETRGKDKVTDVLSFRDSDSTIKNKNFLGEIIIDFQQIKRQAKKYRTSVKRELIFVLVHGLLHLVGYNDQTDSQAKQMDDLAKKFIDKR